MQRREFLELAGSAALALVAQRSDALFNSASESEETGFETTDRSVAGTTSPELVFLSAHEMAALVRSRTVSSLELLDSHLAQIERHNAALNAIVTMDLVSVKERARMADRALDRGEIWGPLHGVPVTIKDALETAGMRTTSGFPPLKNYIPKTDATVVARLRSAGAIILGKTNLPTLAGGYYTDNPVFGVTNNPWNKAYAPGGSTGGGAAAVASGMSPLEIGSDLGGSIRWPAHCCELFALKPTEWRVPWTGHIPELPGHPRGVRHMLVLGPLARSVEDLTLALHIIAGPDGKMWEIPPAPLSREKPIPLKGLRVAFVEKFEPVPPTTETSSSLRKLAGDLSDLGAHVEALLMQGYDFDTSYKTNRRLFEAEVPEALPTGKSGPGMREYFEILARKDAFTAVVEATLERFDVILCPAATRHAFPHTSGAEDQAVDGKLLDYDMAAGWYVKPFSLTGNPVVILPLTRSKDGLPIGFQLVGKRWGEARLLSIAAAISKVSGGFVRPPGY